jgi:[ribosomal protein S5]-alanine N-acetyltransferase
MKTNGFEPSPAKNKMYLQKNKLQMESFPELITKRLRLRRIQLEDVSSLIKYANNKNISDQILNIPFPYGEEDAIHRFNFIVEGFKNKERYVFAITFKDENELIGETGLHLDKNNNSAQFGYWIAEPFWNNGIASEAVAAILQFGFEKLHLNKIYATHFPENKASGKVMLKNKMIREGELKDHYKVNDDYKSVIQYRLTKEEYKEQKAQ